MYCILLYITRYFFYLDDIFALCIITIYFIIKILKTVLKYHSSIFIFHFFLFIKNHIYIFYTAVLVINCSCKNVKWQSGVLSSVMFNGSTFCSGTFTSGLFVRGRVSAGDKREICLHVRSEACAGLLVLISYTLYTLLMKCSVLH